MTTQLKIRNWSEFQHYKDRNPPWIKLHFSLLSSEDWVVLDDASRVLAVACMLVASRTGGFVRVDPKGVAYIKRVAYLNSEPDFKPLIECGFLVHASGEQADASVLQAEFRPETETETETETEAEAEGRVRAREAPPPKSKNRVSRPDDIDEQVWSDFLAHRRQKKAKLTPTAWNRIRKQLDLGIADGHDPNDMLAVAMAAGWQGFEYDWYLNRIGKNGSSSDSAVREFVGDP